MKITKSKLKQIIREELEAETISETDFEEDSHWQKEARALIDLLQEFSDRYVSLVVKSGMNDLQMDRSTEDGQRLSDKVNQVEDGIRSARDALFFLQYKF